MYPNKITNFNAFLDGESFFGKVTEGTVPQVVIKQEDHRGAGMDGIYGVDMGTEKMGSKLTFGDWPTSVLKMVGTYQRLTLRPAAFNQRDFTAQGFIFVIGGQVTKASPDTLKPGNDNPLMFEQATVDYFKVETNGEVLVEVDVENAIRRVAGVDQLAQIRAAMSIF